MGLMSDSLVRAAVTECRAREPLLCQEGRGEAEARGEIYPTQPRSTEHVAGPLQKGERSSPECRRPSSNQSVPY